MAYPSSSNNTKNYNTFTVDFSRSEGEKLNKRSFQEIECNVPDFSIKSFEEVVAAKRVSH